MKILKRIALGAASVMALMGIGASVASATTLEVGGVSKSEAVSITLTLAPGSTMVLGSTAGTLQNTCTSSHMQGASVSPFSGTTVSVPLTTLTTGGCNFPVTADNPGKLEIEWTSGTNGTVYSSESQVTVGTAFGTLNCKVAKALMGTLTGVASGHATLDVKSVGNCGFLLPSILWEAQYVVTSPTGLGVIK